MNKLKEFYHKYDYTIKANFILESIIESIIVAIIFILLFLLGNKDVNAETLIPDKVVTSNSGTTVSTVTQYSSINYRNLDWYRYSFPESANNKTYDTIYFENSLISYVGKTIEATGYISVSPLYIKSLDFGGVSCSIDYPFTTITYPDNTASTNKRIIKYSCNGKVTSNNITLFGYIDPSTIAFSNVFVDISKDNVINVVTTNEDINDNLQNCRDSVNLFDVNRWINNLPKANSGTLTYNNGKFTLICTGGDCYTSTYGTNTWNTSYFKDYRISVEPNTTYTLSALLSNPKASLYLFAHDENGAIVKSNTSLSLSVKNKISITTTDNTKYLTFRIDLSQQVGSSTTISDIQLQEGSSATNYEPFGQICSNKLDDNTDKIIDAIEGDGLDVDNINPSQNDTLDDYKNAESQFNFGSLDLSNINLGLDPKVAAKIWSILQTLLDTNSKLLGFIISMLSVGLIKLFLGR